MEDWPLCCCTLSGEVKVFLPYLVPRSIPFNPGPLLRGHDPRGVAEAVPAMAHVFPPQQPVSAAPPATSKHMATVWHARLAVLSCLLFQLLPRNNPPCCWLPLPLSALCHRAGE